MVRTIRIFGGPISTVTSSTELRVHFEDGLWKAYKVGVKGEEHPMIDVIRTIVTAYKTTGTKTKVMPARCVLLG